MNSISAVNRQPDPTRPESITSNRESCKCYANWTNENHLNFCTYSQSGVHSTWILVSCKTNAFGGTLVMTPHLHRPTWHSTFTTKEKGQCSLYAVLCNCNRLCSSQPSQPPLPAVDSLFTVFATFLNCTYYYFFHFFSVSRLDDSFTVSREVFHNCFPY